MYHRCFAFFRSTFAVILTLGLVAAPALADNPYGAIAISKNTGKTAVSRNFFSQSAANARAVSRCNALTNGQNDCVATVQFHHFLCGALAVDNSQATWRGGLGNTIFEARNNAIANLANIGYPNGTIAQTQCNTAGFNNGGGSNSGFSNNKYGAIAVSPSTMSHYGSWNLTSQSNANNAAISGCNGRSNGNNDCEVAIAIHAHTCGAVAEDTSQNTFKGANANTRSQAGSNALAALGSSNGTVVQSVCNNNSANTSNNSSKNNLFAGLAGLVAGIAAVSLLSHHHAAATPTPVPAAPVAPAAVAVAPAAVAPASSAAATPPPVVAFGAAHFGSIAVNAAGTYATVSSDRDSAGGASVDAINACNAKVGGTGCSSHVVFSTTPDELCGAVAVRHSAQGALIGSATAGNERDAEARALMKAGTGATILAYGCNTAP